MIEKMKCSQAPVVAMLLMLLVRFERGIFLLVLLEIYIPFAIREAYADYLLFSVEANAVRKAWLASAMA